MYHSSGPVPAEVAIVLFLLPYAIIIVYFIYFVAQKIREHQQVAQRSHTIDQTAGIDYVNDTARDNESVALMGIGSENTAKLSISVEASVAMDMMDHSSPYLREPLLQEM